MGRCVSLVDFLVEGSVVLGSGESVGEVEVDFLAELDTHFWSVKRILLPPILSPFRRKQPFSL